MNDNFDPKQIDWEDQEATEVPAEKVLEDDFAAMLASSDDDGGFDQDLTIGEKVSGRVVTKSDNGDFIIDLGAKLSGILAVADMEGEVAIGTEVVAVVTGVDGTDVNLSMKQAAALASKEQLFEAMRTKLAVKGRVVGSNKGGFEVKIGGQKAFCPLGQMDSRFIHDKSQYLNREFDFLIQKIAGRDILVSREAFLKQEARAAVQNLLDDFESQKDKVYEGVVTELKDFGAFVSIGSLEGMVHVSELGYARVQKPGDVLSVGEKIKVKILSIEPKGDNYRVAMSIKAAQSDPWDSLDWLKAGESCNGEVVRLADFGAFVQLREGIDGVVHISEMSWTKRVRHPSDLLKIGDKVTVRVLSVDLSKRRISLSLKNLEEDPWLAVETTFAKGSEHKGSVEKLKNFGAIIELQEGVTGMLPLGVIKQVHGEGYRKVFATGEAIGVVIAEVDREEKKIRLTLKDAADDSDGKEDYKEYVAAKKTESSKQQEAEVGSFGALLQAQLKKKN